MEMDEKCELASELLDYVWYDVIQKGFLVPKDHSMTASNGDVVYIEEAQNLFEDLLEIIEKVTEEE